MPTRRQLFTFWLEALAEPPPPPPRPVPEQEYLPPFLRPPGALPEDELLRLCEPCDACAKACPYSVILPLGPAYGAAAGTPAVLPRDGPCRLCDGLPCAAACPTGALRPVPISEVRMGTARLAPERCWAVQGQPCDYCVTACPIGETALRWDGGRPEVVADGCVGCGLCVHYCTATPPALAVEAPSFKAASGACRSRCESQSRTM